MTRRALVWIAVLTFGAAAHSPSPDHVVAGVANGLPDASIASAERDPRNPRVLVIRVADAWARLPVATRLGAARAWRTDWRHAVADGVVAVLDARTNAPVVRYRPGGDALLVSSSR